MAVPRHQADAVEAYRIRYRDVLEESRQASAASASARRTRSPAEPAVDGNEAPPMLRIMLLRTPLTRNLWASVSEASRWMIPGSASIGAATRRSCNPAESRDRRMISVLR